MTDRVDLLDADFTETPRQRQVLDAVAQGLENKEIAQNLGISEQRTKELVSGLLKKFAVGSRAALTRAAVNMRILGSAAHDTVPYSYLFDEAPILIAVTEGPEHRYLLVNSAYVQAFGDRQYIGRTVHECFPDAVPEALAALDRTYAIGERHLESELRSVIQMPDGARREFVLSFINEPTRSEANEITGLVFYGCDVTGLVSGRRAAERPSTDEGRLLDELPIAIVRLGPDERVAFINEAARVMIGSEARSTDATLPELVLLDPHGAAFPDGEGPAAVARRGSAFDGDGLVRRVDGDSVQVHVQARPHRGDNGASAGVMIVLRTHSDA